MDAWMYGCCPWISRKLLKLKNSNAIGKEISAKKVFLLQFIITWLAVEELIVLFKLHLQIRGMATTKKAYKIYIIK